MTINCLKILFLYQVTDQKSIVFLDFLEKLTGNEGEKTKTIEKLAKSKFKIAIDEY